MKKKVFLILYMIICSNVFGFEKNTDESTLVCIGKNKDDIYNKYSEFKDLENLKEEDFFGEYINALNTDTIRIIKERKKINMYFSTIECDSYLKLKYKSFKIINNKIEGLTYYKLKYTGKMAYIYTRDYGNIKGLLLREKLSDGTIWTTFYRKNIYMTMN